MSGNFSQPTEIVERIINVEKVPSTLSEDPKPTLAADLDAHGKSIKNVDVLYVESIACNSLMDIVRSEAVVEAKKVKASCAEKTHKHELTDMPFLEGYVDNIVDIATSRKAEKEHSHKAEDLEGMIEMITKVASGMGFAKGSHSHNDLEENIEKALKSLETKVDIADVNAFIIKMAEATKILSERISKLDENTRANTNMLSALPEPKEPEVQPEEIVVKVFVSEKILIPSKCNGMVIVTMKATGFDGEHQTFSTEKKIGDSVKTDEVVTIKAPKPCFVRILFRHV